MQNIRSGAIEVVEGLVEQGYSIKESLEVLAEAKRKIKNIRRTVDKQTEGILLKEASQRHEKIIGDLYNSVKGL